MQVRSTLWLAVALSISAALGSDAASSNAAAMPTQAEAADDASECTAYFECFSAHCDDLSRACTQDDCADYVDCARSCEVGDAECQSGCIDDRSDACLECLDDATSCAVEHCSPALADC